MLIRMHDLKGMRIGATDGDIGRVSDAYFDDHHWGVRYFVVDTGGWLTRRKVLISPRSVRQVDRAAGVVKVELTREQVKHSPDIDADRPVSRQHELAIDSYYGYPSYWGGPFLWGGSPYPGMVPLPADLKEKEEELRRNERASSDPNLRSSEEVIGYHIQATDDALGHVEDFLIDDDSWAVIYLLVDTRNWWPGGKQILIARDWVNRVEWESRKVYVELTRHAVEDSPQYDVNELPNRDYESELYKHYERKAYWNMRP